MTKIHLLIIQALIVTLILPARWNLFAQTSLEISYYKPLEAAGGGYTTSNAAYVLRCNPRYSLFLFAPADAETSMEELAWNNYELDIWLGEDEHWVYKDFTNNSLTEFITSIQDNKYAVDDMLHPMDWNILDETKYIGGLLVKKASCEHRGRTYTAWFAPAIPISNGPWKLGGLPGLILEAYDDEKEVVFLFKSLKQTDGQPIIKPNSKGKAIALKAYLEESEKEMKQYMEFMEARMKGAGADVDIEFDTNYTFWEYLK